MQNNLNAEQFSDLIHNPVIYQQIVTLDQNFDLTISDVQWLSNHPQEAANIYGMASGKEFDDFSSVSTRLIIRLAQNNQLPLVADSPTYQQIMEDFAEELEVSEDNIEWTIQFAFAMAIESAKLRFDHPEWNEVQVYWNAFWNVSNQAIHLGLDGIGLLPVVGEFADLTNGLLYYCEGDWQNGTLSISAAIPFVGWFSTGAKYCQKIVNASGNACTLVWKADNTGNVTFGSERVLKRLIKPSQGYIAHHVIPLQFSNHPVVQAAAKANGYSPWHMNDWPNGLGVAEWRHIGSHYNYNTQIGLKLKDIGDAQGNNLDPQICLNELINLSNTLKQAINSNPNLTVNQIVIP